MLSSGKSRFPLLTLVALVSVVPLLIPVVYSRVGGSMTIYILTWLCSRCVHDYEGKRPTYSYICQKARKAEKLCGQEGKDNHAAD